MSREIEIKIAKKIMGWKLDHSDGIDWYSNPSREGVFLQESHFPSYYSNIDDAMEIVYKITKTKVFPGYWTCNIDVFSDESIVNFCRVYTIGDEEEYEARSASLPEAICLAALKTLNEKKPR